MPKQYDTLTLSMPVGAVDPGGTFLGAVHFSHVRCGRHLPSVFFAGVPLRLPILIPGHVAIRIVADGSCGQRAEPTGSESIKVLRLPSNQTCVVGFE